MKWNLVAKTRWNDHQILLLFIAFEYNYIYPPISYRYIVNWSNRIVCYCCKHHKLWPLLHRFEDTISIDGELQILIDQMDTVPSWRNYYSTHSNRWIGVVSRQYSNPLLGKKPNPDIILPKHKSEIVLWKIIPPTINLFQVHSFHVKVQEQTVKPYLFSQNTLSDDSFRVINDDFCSQS